ncbi:hypothetical protein A2Z00_02535 [Candidatus Gottesmanbacteria bacterium RBG_13_45_10]|uniref:YfhO family protein n=1 Tax=Candidatus Gottesmanbacteria bacterium RBG_13_45_10 TaxID=1798370 RepID=A0A1F5ZFQ6_9BACT|nr:MAG: hypothetical protein A2Z00_02535 [Candidatus Gottesmanbacteria bacterium RBG_13_45_10]
MKDESFYTGIYPSTTDTGESSPIWSVRFMEHSAASPMEIIEGKAAITPTKRTTTVHEYSVVAKSPSRLLENTLYFPGWKVYIDGIQKGIQFQDPAYRGLITFNMTEGQHDVRVVFEDTKLRRIADLISIVSIGILAVGVVGGLLWGKKK